MCVAGVGLSRVCMLRGTIWATFMPGVAIARRQLPTTGVAIAKPVAAQNNCASAGTPARVTAQQPSRSRPCIGFFLVEPGCPMPLDHA
jgi:hypothetical protein